MLRLLFSIPLALLVGAAAAGAAPAADANAGQARAFVQEFYTWYRDGAVKHNRGSMQAMRLRREAFSPELRRAMEADEAASRKHPGEIVGLDFDPFFNAQDIAERFTTGRAYPARRGYRVEVFGTWGGKRNRRPDVIPELVRQNGRWVFVNFYYPSPDKPAGPGDNLLDVLRELRQDRSKRRL